MPVVAMTAGGAGSRPHTGPRETRHSNGRTRIYTGVGIDVPGSPPDDPETIYQATARAIEAGAHGIVVSREYEEMEIEHLRAVGRAMRV